MNELSSVRNREIRNFDESYTMDRGYAFLCVHYDRIQRYGNYILENVKFNEKGVRVLKLGIPETTDLALALNIPVRFDWVLGYENPSYIADKLALFGRELSEAMPNFVDKSDLMSENRRRNLVMIIEKIKRSQNCRF